MGQAACMTVLPGYAIGETLLEDGEGRLYRGLDPAGNPVLLRLAGMRQLSRRDVQRLRHDYEIARQLTSSEIVRPIALVSRGDLTVLVLADPGGQMLDRFLGTPMPMDRFLPIATRTSSPRTSSSIPGPGRCG
jgi:hypothetical protein